MATPLNSNNVSSPRPVRNTPLDHGPAHYARWVIQPAEFCLANNLDFVRGNIIKYIMRYDEKDGIEDLRKAFHYLEMLFDEANKGSTHDC